VTLVDAYLARLGRAAAPAPTLDALRALHRAHLQVVPFENSSVLFREPILLDEEWLVAKIARDGRGGICYELNGAFGWLLERLGYRVERLPARFHGGGALEPRFGHLALRVTLDEAWLVDVGAGYSFEAPLRLVLDAEQDDPNGRFRLIRPEPAPDDVGEIVDVEWRHADGEFRPHYRFETATQPLDAFRATCEWTRTSPDSPFIGGWACARATGTGWATLDGHRLVVSDGAQRESRDVDDAELTDVLERWFGVVTPAPLTGVTRARLRPPSPLASPQRPAQPPRV
jgi:N-hydroxyarylamine O-acetyltransferase